jgi:SnoaL-like domain
MESIDAQWAVDQLNIRAIAYRYASSVDRRDPEGFLSVFRSDARLRVHRSGPDGDEVVSTFTGHDELARIPGLITRYSKTFHFVGNHLCDISGDQATGEVYCTARHLTPGTDGGTDGGTDYVMLIRYQDVYRREPGGPWLIHERDLFVDWSEDHAGVVR